MSKSAFEKIAAGLSDAIAIVDGQADPSSYRVHRSTDIDVKGIRRRLNMTQVEFAARFGFNVARLRDWEQHRSGPDSAVRAYLTVIAEDPEAVERALASSSSAGQSKSTSSRAAL
jgi:putative transcriptional regulator